MNNSLKSTGMVRKVDELGRVVLPKEIRTVLGIEPKTPLEIYIDGDRLVLKKYEPFCIFCGSSKGLVSLDDKNVCEECVKQLHKKVR